ncbi:copper transport protein ctr1 [Tritrichomonas musculus]|uniref:Copper transport protein ctr1 n=1 Tax=Tritrichomonas musculus TaxID=1915356 RepID=A0ABR2J1M0_9EUKA
MLISGCFRQAFGENNLKLIDENLNYFDFDISSLLSFSMYYGTSIFIKKDGSAFALGDNTRGTILNTVPKEIFKKEQQLILKKANGVLCKFISSVSGCEYTLYLVSSSDSRYNQLVYSSGYLKGEVPLFVKLNGQNPLKLYGGYNVAAAINADGSMIIITRSILESPNDPIEAVFLPNGEKAASIACLDRKIIVASSSEHVFESSLPKIEFRVVSELEGKKIAHVSGINTHCLAISRDGLVFARGNNYWGEIGIGEGKSSPSQFVEVTTFGRHKIKSVSAGFAHSLFLTTEGKVLGCGHNSFRGLPIKERTEFIYLPIETLVTKDATFCVAASNSSVIFTKHDPPPNMPNTPLAPVAAPVPPPVVPGGGSGSLEQENARLKAEIAKLKEKIAALTAKPPEKVDHTPSSITILDSDAVRSLRIVREINVGGSGKVVEVVKEVQYALKIMNAGDSSVKSQRSFLKEYELINMLGHPNIIKTYGIYLSDATTPPSILLEFCPTDLNKLIKSGKLTNTLVIIYIYQITEAMRYVHFKGVVHRDLKPTNILISKDGLIRVSDFGIAKLMSTEEQSTTLGAGTQKFMAPEILKEEDYNEKADVYSFGVILFFILSGGKMPKINIIDVGTGRKAEIPSSFTQFAKNLINSCWNFKPDDRPSFKTIIDEMVKNKFALLELNSSELNEVQDFVKEHQKRIPHYSD